MQTAQRNFSTRGKCVVLFAGSVPKPSPSILRVGGEVHRCLPRWISFANRRNPRRIDTLLLIVMLGANDQATWTVMSIANTFIVVIPWQRPTMKFIFRRDHRDVTIRQDE